MSLFYCVYVAFYITSKLHNYNRDKSSIIIIQSNQCSIKTWKSITNKHQLQHQCTMKIEELEIVYVLNCIDLNKRTLYIYLLGKGRYVSGSFCLSFFIFLFVCKQHYSKGYERITMKLILLWSNRW